MMAMLQMARNGGNPMQMLQQMAGQNPQAAQAMRLIQGKNPQQLRQIAENMAKERGVDLNQIARQMGVTLPKFLFLKKSVLNCFFKRHALMNLFINRTGRYSEHRTPLRNASRLSV